MQFKTSRKIRFVLFIVLFASGMGCSRNAEQYRPAELDLGEALQNNKVTRIISTAPSITEIIAGLGLADRIIAIDRYSRDVEGVQADLPEIDFFYPDIEVIAGLNADIIITGEINTGGSTASPFEYFTRFGTRVVVIPTANSINDIYNDIITIASELGVEERGEELVRLMREQIAASSAAGRALSSDLSVAGRQRIYFEIAPAPNIVSFGRGTYLNELIELSGAENIFVAEERWFTPNAEAIIRSNPDIIFILADEGTEAFAIEEIISRPGFQAITAVQQGRIYPVHIDQASRPSQNIVLALEKMLLNIYH